uniref:Mitochondrial carrier protein n=1 Tax=Globodera rostochiensis TaxID=31243 RepID=A0A914I1N9_GLORO
MPAVPACMKPDFLRQRRYLTETGTEAREHPQNTASNGGLMAESGWKEFFIHFTGGALGGTAGTAITCPLEVVKTRLQSSHGHEIRRHVQFERLQGSPTSSSSSAASTSKATGLSPHRFVRRLFHQSVLFRSFQSVWREGRLRALYKGLGPNLVGVAPSKAVYFGCYSCMKRFLNEHPEWIQSNSHSVHMLSAGSAALVTATAINPIWLVKTRLQLSPVEMRAFECARRIRRAEGILAFWRGVTGSYIGITETMLQFMIYEHLREKIQDPQVTFIGKQDGQNFWQFMLAGGTAKLVAGFTCYPHEVIRTRLREEGSSQRLRDILLHIVRVEGWRTFWRGVLVQLIRSVPNTAFTIGTYELVVHSLHWALANDQHQKRH